MQSSILIVDDQESIRHFVSKALGDEGYTVQTTGSLREARQVLEHDVPDLGIFDLKLPDGTVSEGIDARMGESWYRGQVVLSWNDVLRGAADVGADHHAVDGYAGAGRRRRSAQRKGDQQTIGALRRGGRTDAGNLVGDGESRGAECQQPNHQRCHQKFTLHPVDTFCCCASL